MTEYEIRRQISDLEERIQFQRQLIRKQENRYSDLQALKSKINAMQQDFQYQNEARKNSLSRLFQMAVKAKTAKAYYEGMQGLLTGRSFNNALSGLDEARAKTDQEIRNCQNAINEAEMNIARYRNSIDSLNAMLIQVISQAGEASC